MNIQELKITLPVLMRNRIVPFIWGAQGVGKTQSVKQLAKELDYGFVHLHLATQEVGDIVGLLVHNMDGTVKHARPEWFPTEGKGILFLDELNRAHPDVIQAAFSLITERTIHTHKLPEGWSIVAAGNYQNSQFNVTDTSDCAWMSRFCHIDFTPSMEEFTAYAEEKESFNVAGFIREHPELLEHSVKDRFNFSTVTPDRRAWLDFLGKLDTEKDIDNNRYEVYSGLVGQVAASSYLSWLKKKHSRLSGRQVLSQYEEVQERVKEYSKDKDTRFDLLSSAAEEIHLYMMKKELSNLELENLKQFILDVPLELGLKICKKLHDIPGGQKNEILNNPTFVKQFKKEKL